MRKQREEFRKELVHLILRDHDDVGPDEIPSQKEKEVLRYYYYIKYGVDTVYVAPLDKYILQRVMKLVPKRLLKWKNELQMLIEEIKEDYMIAIKKAIVDFVLRDPTLNVESVVEEELPHRSELAKIYGTMIQTLLANRNKLCKSLHIVNPCLAGLHDMWNQHFQ